MHAAHSAVLASIFRSTDDGEDTVITIDGVEHTDLENVLNFIYLGKVFVCGVCWSFQFMDNIKKEIFEFNLMLSWNLSLVLSWKIAKCA